MLLQRIKEKSDSLVVRIILGIFLLGFLMTGFLEYFVRQGSVIKIVNVDGESIDAMQFDQKLKEVVSQVVQNTRDIPTPKQLKEMGVIDQVIKDMVNQILITHEAKDLHLTIDTGLLKEFVKKVPAFMNAQGQFDPRALKSYLSKAGITEKQFLDDIGRSVLTQQLMSFLMVGSSLPKAYVDLIYKAVAQKKYFYLGTIPLSSVTVSKEPTEAELKIFYEHNKLGFQKPEFRSLDVIWVSPSDIAKGIKITDEKVKEAYNSSPSSYAIPEKRTLSLVVFEDEASANAALHKILKEKKPFDNVVKEYKGLVRTVKDLTKGKLPEELDKIAFSLEVNRASQVFQLPQGGGVGFIYINAITPAKERSFDQVKDLVKKNLIQEDVSNIIYGLKNKIEDGLSSGDTLPEIAKAQNIKLYQIPEVARYGQLPNGQELNVFPEPIAYLILDKAFALKNNDQSGVEEIQEGPEKGGFYVVNTRGIKPSYVPEFKSIVPGVKAKWIDDQKISSLEKVYQDLQKHGKTPEDFASILEKNKGKSEKVPVLNQVTLANDKNILSMIPAQLLSKGMTLAPSQVAWALTGSGNDKAVKFLLLNKVEDAVPVSTDVTFKKFAEMLQNDYRNDAIASYLDGLKTRRPVEVDEKAINQLIEKS